MGECWESTEERKLDRVLGVLIRGESESGLRMWYILKFCKARKGDVYKRGDELLFILQFDFCIIAPGRDNILN